MEKLAREYGEKMKVLVGQFVGTSERLVAMAYIAGINVLVSEVERLEAQVEALETKLGAMTLVADDHAVARLQKSAALEMFDNRRKLAYSLRAESPQVAAFVEAIGVEMDKILKPRAQS